PALEHKGVAEANVRDAHQLMTGCENVGVAAKHVAEKRVGDGVLLLGRVHAGQIRERDPNEVVLVVVDLPIDVGHPTKVLRCLVQSSALLRDFPQLVQGRGDTRMDGTIRTLLYVEGLTE